MSRITKAVIPAAGFGTRFLPATKAQPKEMLTVVDKPVIQYIVEEAVAAGITDVIIITGQNKRAIEDHFDRNFELEFRLKEQKKVGLLKDMRRLSEMANFIYIRQRQALGDGHALLEAAALVKNEPFAVLFGDDIIDSPTPLLKTMIETHKEYGGPVVGVSRVPKNQVSRYGIVAARKIKSKIYQMKGLVEKPRLDRAPSTLAICGRHIVTPALFATLGRLPKKRGKEIRLADALSAYVQKHPAYAVEAAGPWYDCGSKLGFLKATVELAHKHPDLNRDFENYLRHR